MLSREHGYIGALPGTDTGRADLPSRSHIRTTFYPTPSDWSSAKQKKIAASKIKSDDDRADARDPMSGGYEVLLLSCGLYNGVGRPASDIIV